MARNYTGTTEFESGEMTLAMAASILAALNPNTANFEPETTRNNFPTSRRGN
ncbi:MAG: hypothetical protein LUP98_04680 [Methylococcaceae bacterium]|nr:hypothetical protein [Methylococcaceae bacterium]